MSTDILLILRTSNSLTPSTDFTASSRASICPSESFMINSALINSVLVGTTKEEQEKLQVQATAFQEIELRDILKLFLDAENKMKYSSIPQLPLELAIIEAINKESK